MLNLHWADATVALTSEAEAAALVDLVFGARRSQHLRRIELALYDPFGSFSPPADDSDDANPCLSLLSAALELLQAGGYDGELLLDGFVLRDPRDAAAFWKLAQESLFIPTCFGHIDLRKSYCSAAEIMGGLSQLSASEDANLCVLGFDKISLPALPDYQFSTALSSVAPIRCLTFGDDWELPLIEPPEPAHGRTHTPDGEEEKERGALSACSLRQLGGLSNLAGLRFLPRVRACEMPTVATFQNLVKLELYNVTLKSWNRGLGSALTALTKLSELRLYVWDPAVPSQLYTSKGDPRQSVSPLCGLLPLSLPNSVSHLSLWLRLPTDRFDLRLNAFQGMGSGLTSLMVAAVGCSDIIRGRAGSEQFALTLGPSIGCLASLKNLRVQALGAFETRTIMWFSRELSCLTGLTSLKTFGSCGSNHFGALPPSWVVGGFRDEGTGEFLLESLHKSLPTYFVT